MGDLWALKGLIEEGIFSHSVHTQTLTDASLWHLLPFCCLYSSIMVAFLQLTFTMLFLSANCGRKRMKVQDGLN